MSWSWTIGESMPGGLRIQCLTQKNSAEQGVTRVRLCQVRLMPNPLPGGTLNRGVVMGWEEGFGLSFRHTSPKS